MWRKSCLETTFNTDILNEFNHYARVISLEIFLNRLVTSRAPIHELLYFLQVMVGTHI